MPRLASPSRVILVRRRECERCSPANVCARARAHPHPPAPPLTRSSFSGRSISVKQVGHAVLRVANSSGSEDLYLITLPNLVIEGLWYGAPYLELSGTSHIVSSTGMLATINYAGKGERATTR